MGGFFSNIGKFFTGSPAKRKNVSTLRPEQEPLYEQLVQAGQNPGAGGAFGTAADYYRNLLSNNPQDFQAMANPEIRRFNEDIIPSLSEQFAGMGAGGLSSSGFRNAAVNAGADLSERLGAIRANLRQQGAQGLSNIGQQGLNSFSQNMETRAATPGLLGNFAPTIGSNLASSFGAGSFGGMPGTEGGGGGGSGSLWGTGGSAIGTGIGAAIGGPGGAAIGSNIGQAAGNWLGNAFGGKKVGGNSSPYGTQSLQAPQKIQLPNFGR